MTDEQQLATLLSRIRHAEALCDYPKREALIYAALEVAKRLGYPTGLYRGEAEPLQAICQIELPTGIVNWRIPPSRLYESIEDVVQWQRCAAFCSAHVPPKSARGA